MTKPPDETVTGDEKTRRPGLPWPLWVAGLIFVVGAILAVFGR